MNIIQNLKEWIRGLSVTDDEIIIYVDTYKKLREQEDELKKLKNKFSVMELEKDTLQKKYDELTVEYEHDKRRINVLESTQKYEANRYEKLQSEYDKIKNNNAQVKFELKTDKTENTKTKKPKPAHHNEILFGTSNETGLIKKNKHGTWLYVYSPHDRQSYMKRGELEKLKTCLRIFNEKGCPYHQFHEICETVIPDKRRKTDKLKYIIPNGAHYKIVTSRNGQHIHFGTCATIKQAVEIRDYLIFKNWDECYRSRNLNSKKKLSAQEYYNLMKVYIDMDSEYQEYLGNKETKEFYD